MNLKKKFLEKNEKIYNKRKELKTNILNYKKIIIDNGFDFINKEGELVDSNLEEISKFDDYGIRMDSFRVTIKFDFDRIIFLYNYKVFENGEWKYKSEFEGETFKLNHEDYCIFKILSYSENFDEVYNSYIKFINNILKNFNYLHKA